MVHEWGGVEFQVHFLPPATSTNPVGKRGGKAPHSCTHELPAHIHDPSQRHTPLQPLRPSHNYLSGILPPSLASNNFTSGLLFLDHNRLGGPLPPFSGTELTALDLSYNQVPHCVTVTSWC